MRERREVGQRCPVAAGGRRDLGVAKWRKGLWSREEGKGRRGRRRERGVGWVCWPGGRGSLSRRRGEGGNQGLAVGWGS